MTAALGTPREPLTTSCQNDKGSAAVARLLEIRRMSPRFRLNGIKPALDAVERIMAKLKTANPE